ncbi:MAG: AbrB/MazE/SpoVT family DNA-binding domain-containing protein [Anaerolineales bacterium]|nr:AbrB/MazE/SpoVT family DNA-binding domain-containing protein [Anaerolineales bacterium]
MTIYVRIQEKGQVTIPTKIRKKLNLRKGDMVMFVETEAGVLIQPAEVLVSQALDKIGESLRADGITPEKWNKRSRDIRKQLLEEMYGLKVES